MGNICNNCMTVYDGIKHFCKPQMTGIKMSDFKVLFNHYLPPDVMVVGQAVYDAFTNNFTNLSLDTFLKFESPSTVKNTNDMLLAFRALEKEIKLDDEELIFTEIWQSPIPFSRTLAFATLFRFNPYDRAYLVSPVRMEWLEQEPIGC